MAKDAQSTVSPSHSDLDGKSHPGFPSNPSSSSHSTPTSLITTEGGDEVCVLEPTSKNSSPESIPTNLLVSGLVQMGRVKLREVVFPGWRGLDIEWERWVKAMACEEKYVKIWRKAGIEDAIMGSVCWIDRDPGLLEALMGFWCPETRSFILPWGEITFTLEDAYVLGNFPIRGGKLKRKLNVEEERLSKRLRKGISFPYVKYLLNLKGNDNLRHLAFLAYWLSRFVFPSRPIYIVPDVVFGLAARLSKGERLALAPTVLANMYIDLSEVITKLSEGYGKIEVWAPFRLLQAWIWEHFVSLRSKTRMSIGKPSKVRLTRFVSYSKTYIEAVQILRDEGSFSWRPYVEELDNWVKPEWYISVCKRIFVAKDSPDWVHDFLAILSCADIVGLDRYATAPVEKYKPHRVARQLGYDQAIPGVVCNQFTCWGLSTQHLDTRVEVFMPRTIRPVASLSGYVKWWNEYIESYLKMVKEYMSKK